MGWFEQPPRISHFEPWGIDQKIDPIWRRPAPIFQMAWWWKTFGVNTSTLGGTPGASAFRSASVV